MIEIKNCLTEYIDRICDIDKTSSSYNWTREQFKRQLEISNEHLEMNDNELTTKTLDCHADKSAHNDKLFKGLFVDDVIAGFIVYGTILDEAEILNIVIDNKYKGQGYGKYLLQETLNELKYKNIKTVFLEVGDKNFPAISLYKKFGFEIYNKREKYYKNGEDAIMMKKSIL